MNAAEDGAVFTLLDDTTLSNNVKICDNNKTVTLNLNGHSIEDGRAFWVGGTAVWDAERTGKLIITGKGDIRPPLNIWRSGAIDLSGWKDGTIKYLCAYGNTTITGITSEGYINELSLTEWQANDKCVALNSGRFGKITWVNFGKLELTLGNLLEPGYTFQREDDQIFVSYNEKMLPIQSDISNINVVKCENHADSDSNGKSDYCDGQFAARVVDNNGAEYGYYTDFQDAFDAQTEWAQSIKSYCLTMRAAAIR